VGEDRTESAVTSPSVGFADTSPARGRIYGLWGSAALYPRSFQNKLQLDQQLAKIFIAPILGAETARILTLT